MQELQTFESACKYITGTMSEFKDLIVSKFEMLQYVEWIYNKGTTKVCKADENGKKKRCKVGIVYQSKTGLSVDIVEEIWMEFKSYFGNSNLPKLERITSNEEIGRYVFVALNDTGDEVECVINTPGEWNIPLIGITGFVSARYRNSDFD